MKTIDMLGRAQSQRESSHGTQGSSSTSMGMVGGALVFCHEKP